MAALVAAASGLITRSDAASLPTISFRPVSTTVPAAEWLAVGDFNRDRRPDLAVCGFQSRSGTVLLGRGDGTFTIRRNAFRNISGDLEIADLNKDGKPDLIAGEAYSVVAFLGKGNGRLRVGIHSRLPRSIGQPIALADLDQDGRLDVFGSNVQPGEIAVGFGRRRARFGSPRRFQIHAGVESFTVAEVSGDRRVDLITANGETGSISVALASGASFRPAQPYDDPDNPMGIVAADFTADGMPDLAVVSNFPENGGLAIFRGVGGGLFEFSARYAPGLAWLSIEALDADADGHLDLATGSVGGDGVTIFRGEGAGTFLPEATYPIGDANEIRTADFNLDGKPDLAVAMEKQVVVFLNET